MKKKILLIALAALMSVSLTGCTEASKVSSNIAVEADNFNITRRLAVINARTDKPLFEMIGNFSLKNNSSNELEVIVESEPGVYKKHFIYLNEWTLYIVEDVSGAEVNQFKYEINFLPEMFIPITFTSND